MSKAIESAAKWADAKSKMRLKHGTCIKAQKRGDVSLAQPRWDQGGNRGRRTASGWYLRHEAMWIQIRVSASTPTG